MNDEDYVRIGKLVTDIRDLKQVICCLDEKRRAIVEALDRARDMFNTDCETDACSLDDEEWREFGREFPDDYPTKEEMVSVVKRVHEAKVKLRGLEERRSQLGV